MNLSRRSFLRTSGAVALAFGGLKHFVQDANGASSSPLAGYGDLLPDPARVLDLPRGFSYTVISRTGETMTDGLLVPGQHDGMAAFPGPGGKTILVRNHEMQPDGLARSPFGPKNELLKKLDPSLLYDAGRGEWPALGGTTTLVFDTKAQKLDSHFLSLAGTTRNCAGGSSPWNSWITCEEDVTRAGEKAERDHGYNFEVPARADSGLVRAVPLKAMGRFNHEAVAFDPRSGAVYQTEDRNDGLLYRFLPEVPGVGGRPGELARGGRLQVLVVKGQKSLDTRNWPLTDGGAGRVLNQGQSVEVEWMDVENVESPADDLRLVYFEKGAAKFARGEGAIWSDEKHHQNGVGAVYIACTSGGFAKKGQIWRYVPSRFEGQPEEKNAPARLELFLEPRDGNLVKNGDNICVAPWGDFVVCEDSSAPQYVVGVTPRGDIYQFARNALNSSEFAGSTFSPDGSTLFVNIQSPGLTLAITGPWRA
jgi:secreted PhoX family phosphatase